MNLQFDRNTTDINGSPGEIVVKEKREKKIK